MPHVFIQIALLISSVTARAEGPEVRVILRDEAGARHFVVTRGPRGWGVLELESDRETPQAAEVIEGAGGWDLRVGLTNQRTLLVAPAIDRETPGTSYLVHPDRAPERLRRIPVTEAEVAALGLTERVALPPNRYVRSKSPARVPPRARLYVTSRRIAGNEGRVLPYELEILTPETLAARTRGVREILTTWTEELHGELGPLTSSLPIDEAREILGQDQTHVVRRIAAVIRLARGPGPVDAATLLVLRDGLETFAALLEKLRAMVPGEQTAKLNALAAPDRAAAAAGARAADDFTDRVIAPLRARYVETLENLTRLKDRGADRLVLQAAEAADGRPASTDAWFDWLNESVRLLAFVPTPRTFAELKAQGWFSQLHNVPLTHLATEVQLVEAHRTAPGTTAHDIFAHEILDLTPWPLIQLGHADDSAAFKRRMIDFIIDADHRLAQDLPRFANNRNFEGLLPPDAIAVLTEAFRSYVMPGPTSDADLKLLEPYGVSAGPPTTADGYTRRIRTIMSRRGPDGSLLIHRVLGALAKPPRAFARDLTFDLDTYHRNALELVTDLLSVAPEVVRTRGTYASALNAGLELARLRATSARTREAQSKINDVIQRQLLTLVARGTNRCAGDLARDPLDPRFW